VANRGDTANIHLINGLADESITHWHGMIIDDVNDGHPRFAVPSGGTYDYQFPIVQRAALNWYHPHPHGKTGEQVAMGLAGAFIIRDLDEPSALPAGAPYEVPLIIRDAKFDRQGDLEFKTKRSGFEGDTPMVNGTLDPTLAVEPAVYRFRVLNGSNARIFDFAFDNGMAFHMVGNDGGLLPSVVPIGTIVTSPAERLDLLVDFRGMQGATVMLRDLRTGWDLLEFVVGNGPNGQDILNQLPSQLSTIIPLSAPVTTREFAFEGMSRINGREFDMQRIDEYVPFDTVERWVFSTKGNAPHPIHSHAAPFQVVSRTGGRGQVFEWERGWKDSVLLEDGETVEVLVRFDNPVLMQGLDSTYLLHCHKLSHEDAGMMLNFQLTP
jgi:FtsP/CotA-like multicopper oxidase with cupredoxin domain